MRLIPIKVEDQKLCRSLHAIKVQSNTEETSDAKAMFDWLENSLEALRIQNDTLSGSELTRNQGACQVLQSFFDAFGTAQDILSKN